MAGKNWQAGSKDLIPARALAVPGRRRCVGRPCRAMSDTFAPSSYVGSLDPNVLWEVLIGGIVVCAFLAAIALWIHSALAPDQAFAVAPQRLHQLRPEQSQPGRGDDRRAEADRLLQRPLSRDLRPDALRCSTGHDRSEICSSCGASAACSIVTADDFYENARQARRA